LCFRFRTKHLVRKTKMTPSQKKRVLMRAMLKRQPWCTQPLGVAVVEAVAHVAVAVAGAEHEEEAEEAAQEEAFPEPRLPHVQRCLATPLLCFRLRKKTMMRLPPIRGQVMALSPR
jgi:hypothetical protein